MKEPKFPSNLWATVTLGDLSEVKSGVGFPKKYQGQSSGDYPVYKVGDVSRAVTLRQGLLNSANHYVTTEEAGALKGVIFRTGSTLFAKIGEAIKLNRRAFVMRPGLADNNVMAVVPLLNESDRFIHYFLRTVDLSDVSRSTTVPSVRKGDIEDLIIPLPPLAEQKVIADKLDTLLAQVDNTKARLERIPQILKRFRQSVLAAAVSGRLTGISEESFAKIPIEQLAKPQRYSLGIGPFGSNLKVADYREAGHPLIFVREIRANQFGDDATKYVSGEKFHELKAHRAVPGDILITKMGDPPGDVAIYPLECPEAVITADCIKLSVDEKAYSRDYVAYAMQSEQFRRDVLSISAGVAQQKVNLTKFRKLTLRAPPRLEQTEIVRRVDQLFAHADRIEKQVNNALARVNTLTQSILAKAFRGELTEQWRQDHPDLISGENSAEALLERIKAERAATAPARRSRNAKRRR